MRLCRSPQGERGLKHSGPLYAAKFPWSLPARGAWVETRRSPVRHLPSPSLPARGAWVETFWLGAQMIDLRSLPARGAWVETRTSRPTPMQPECRSPQGERGLKPPNLSLITRAGCRSPQGERGLKHEAPQGARPSSRRRSPQGERGLKHPARFLSATICESLPARGAWVETARHGDRSAHGRSLPARGAWVETCTIVNPKANRPVAPRKGSVG